jgi:hypothetical protein
MNNKLIIYFSQKMGRIIPKMVFPFSKIRIIIKRDMGTVEILLKISAVLFVFGLIFSLVRTVISVIKA